MFCTVAMAIIIAVAAVSTLTGCAGSITGSSTTMQGPQLQKLSITGALSYRARIALPPKARAIVELREGSTDYGPVIAEYRMELRGKQVPLPFELVVSRTSLMPGKTYSVRGAVFVDGRPAWVSNSAAIDPAAGSIDVGTLNMLPAPPGAFSSVLSCGDERVTVGFSQTAMLLTVGGKTFEMRRMEVASGARYEAVGDPTTTLWNKGDHQTITVRGRTLPDAARAARRAPSTARGGTSRSGASRSHAGPRRSRRPVGSRSPRSRRAPRPSPAGGVLSPRQAIRASRLRSSTGLASMT